MYSFVIKKGKETSNKMTNICIPFYIKGKETSNKLTSHTDNAKVKHDIYILCYTNVDAFKIMNIQLRYHKHNRKLKVNGRKFYSINGGSRN